MVGSSDRPPDKFAQRAPGADRRRRPVLESRSRSRLSKKGRPFWLIETRRPTRPVSIGAPVRRGSTTSAGLAARSTTRRPAILLAHEPHIFPHARPRRPYPRRPRRAADLPFVGSPLRYVRRRYGQVHLQQICTKRPPLIVSGRLGTSLARCASCGRRKSSWSNRRRSRRELKAGHRTACRRPSAGPHPEQRLGSAWTPGASATAPTCASSEARPAPEVAPCAGAGSVFAPPPETSNSLPRRSPSFRRSTPEARQTSPLAPPALDHRPIASPWRA